MRIAAGDQNRLEEDMTPTVKTAISGRILPLQIVISSTMQRGNNKSGIDDA